MRGYGVILCLCGLLACAPFPAGAAPAEGYALAAGVLDASFPAPAAPEAVTLYPAGARLFVRQTVPVVNGGIRIGLPPGVMADSVTLNVEGRTVGGLSLVRAGMADSPEIARLRAAFESARRNLRRLEGDLSAVRFRQALWTKSETRFAQAADVERMDRLMAEKLPELHEAGQRIEDDLLPVRAGYERLEEAMQEAGALDAEALVLSAALSPPDSGTVLARLSYSLSRCGWRPVYRLEALPGGISRQGPAQGQVQGQAQVQDKGRGQAQKSAQSEGFGEKGVVRFVQEAEIRQGSGRDWNNVRLALAMGDPGGRLEPLPNQPWRIRPRLQLPSPAPRRAALGEAPQRMENSLAAQALDFAPEAASTSISAREQAVYTAWDLGPRDLPAGRVIRLALAEEDWPAVFTRLIRPVQDSRAYLLAKATLPAPRALPSGAASFAVEGETVGNGFFSLAGDEADLSFGADPRVSATMTPDARQSGRTGFVDRRQTLVWNWTIAIRNAHQSTVAVRLEDAKPQTGDEAITTESLSSPVPRVEDQLYIWELELPAGGGQTLTHRVTASAPQDMELLGGR